ncbi:hypothetical protein QU232_004217 [Vibrio vulnificus]|nr:hypothetical protein [Vibrio vulnificus]EHZ2746577.1 hypothetical protein [Vibrio vulnificus]EIU7824559.1 hypothetical protein [Vibrio vulnificus]ELP1869998.1 hypothetical protein [Vibrio vulnificus]HAS8348837.1 hypothetical protein [Vibrio vulnificus]
MKTSEAPVESAPLLKRVATILHELEQNDALELSTSDALTLTDQGLLEHILNAHTQNLHHDPKIIKKLKRQRAGQKKFIEYIERHGGAVKQTEFAKLAGLSRQSLNGKIKNELVITLNSGSTPLVPVFQIDENTTKLLFGLEKVNAELATKELGTSSLCTFWLSTRTRFDGLSARDYLQKNPNIDALENVLFIARREGEMGY